MRYNMYIYIYIYNFSTVMLKQVILIIYRYGPPFIFPIYMHVLMYIRMWSVLLFQKLLSAPHGTLI